MKAISKPQPLRVMPPQKKMKITRRHLLALSAASAAATALCAGGVATQWWAQPADGNHRKLAAEEARFVRGFAGAAFPAGPYIALSGADAGIDDFFDAVLDGMPDITADLLRLLMHALEHAPLPIHGGRFTMLPLDKQQHVLQGWLHHDIAEFRGAVSSLLVLLGMGYTTHPDVAPIMGAWHRCGYGR